MAVRAQQVTVLGIEVMAVEMHDPDTGCAVNLSCTTCPFFMENTDDCERAREDRICTGEFYVSVETFLTMRLKGKL